MRREIILAQQRFFGSHHSYYFFNKAGSNPPMSLLDLRLNFMSDTNTISFTFSKDFQPLIQTAFDDFRQYLKDKAQNELVVEQAKIKASKEKWDVAVKALNKNGALDQLMLQVANKFMGESTVSSKSTESKSKVKKEPNLLSLISKFRISIYSDTDFSKSIESIINKISVSNHIHDLLKCTNEHTARITLKHIRFNIIESDYEHLNTLRTMLSDFEKDLIAEIFNFESQESNLP